MSGKTKSISWVLLALFLTGCADISGPGSGPGRLQPETDTIRPVLRPGRQAATPRQDARTVEEFDTSSAEERMTAIRNSTVGAEQNIGGTIASLGNVAKPGFWLETPLVSEPVRGRVVYPVTGKSVAVDLIPIDGPSTGGSRISLPAIRLLGAPLTSLPELTVYAG